MERAGGRETVMLHGFFRLPLFTSSHTETSYLVARHAQYTSQRPIKSQTDFEKCTLACNSVFLVNVEKKRHSGRVDHLHCKILALYVSGAITRDGKVGSTTFTRNSRSRSHQRQTPDGQRPQVSQAPENRRLLARGFYSEPPCR
jgi:hypothetical protein